jgi:hypothetical protein
LPCQSRWFALPIQLRGVFRPWAGEERGLQPPEKICKYAWKKVEQTSFWPPIFSRIRLFQKWKAIQNKVKPYRRASFPWHVCLKRLPWQPTFFLFRRKKFAFSSVEWCFYVRISDWDNTWSCTLVSKAIGIFIILPVWWFVCSDGHRADCSAGQLQQFRPHQLNIHIYYTFFVVDLHC